jgi:ribosomal protein S17
MAVKEKVGIVVSDKMKDTCIVAVNDRVIHKRYKKLLLELKDMLFTIRLLNRL